MAYKLEHSVQDQMKMLSSTLQKWTINQPDLYFISNEGHKIYTHKVLLGLRNSYFETLLAGFNGPHDMPGISIPVSAGSLVNLIKILSSGVAMSNNKEQLLEVTKTAEVLGIKLANCQIGFKRKNSSQSTVGVSHKESSKVIRFDKPKVELKIKEEILNTEEKIEAQKKVFDNKSTEKNQKVFQCGTCEKQFSARHTLQRHELIHSENPTPFACSLCDKQFDRKYRLEKHKKVAHIEITQDFNTKSEDDLNNEMDQEGEKSTPQQQAVLTENGEDDSGKASDEHIENEDEKEIQNGEEAIDEGLLDDPNIQEKLLEDRKKLLAELSSTEDSKDLDFL